MKFTSVIVFVFSVLTSIAQDVVHLEIDNTTMNNGVECPCYVLSVDEANYDEFKRAGEKWIESHTRSKPTGEGVRSLTGVYFKSLELDTFSLNYAFISLRDEPRLVIHFKQDSLLVSKSSVTQDAIIYKELRRFGYEVYHELLEDKIKVQSSKVKDKERELKRLENDLKGVKKDIDKENLEINDRNRDIGVIEGNIQNYATEIGKLKGQISSAQDKEVKSNLKSSLKDKEHDKKKALKEIEKHQSKIANLESDIHQLKFEQNQIEVSISNQQKEIIQETNTLKALEELAKKYKKLARD